MNTSNMSTSECSLHDNGNKSQNNCEPKVKTQGHMLWNSMHCSTHTSVSSDYKHSIDAVLNYLKTVYHQTVYSINDYRKTAKHTKTRYCIPYHPFLFWAYKIKQREFERGRGKRGEETKEKGNQILLSQQRTD